ncbi:MAG: hypothetical protein JWP89_5350 [Schlesneria sp.]|nr:hypothetical protein [Schlesneria sp.]
MADIALSLLKLGLLLLAFLLVPIVLLLATPFILLWPHRGQERLRHSIGRRYCAVAKYTWYVSEALGALAD